MNEQQKKFKKKKEREKKAKEKVLRRREVLRTERKIKAKEEAEFEKLGDAEKGHTIRYDENTPRPVSHKERKKLLKKINDNKRLLEFLEQQALKEAEERGEDVSEEALEEKFQKALEEATKGQKPIKITPELVKEHKPSMIVNSSKPPK